MNLPLHLLPAELFPVTIRIFSGATGEILWSTIVNPLDGKPVPIQIPGFAGTEHVPVRVEIKHADGSIEIEDNRGDCS